MTRDEALKRLQRILGDKGRYQVGRGVSSPERRSAAQERYSALAAEDTALRQEINAAIEAQFGHRRKPLLDQLAAVDRERFNYKFRVYRRHGAIDVEVAKGDTWEEVFAQLKPERSVNRQSPKNSETPF